MKNIDHIIDEALKSEISFELRKDFKDRVFQSIRKKERAGQRRLYLWMTLGTLVILGFGYAIISYFMPSIFENFGTASSESGKLISLAVSAGVIILLIQYLDKQLVQERLLKHH